MDFEETARTCVGDSGKKRGVRLNFIDIQVKNPAILPPTADWSGMFLEPGRILCWQDQVLTEPQYNSRMNRV